jgi:coenzyme F420 biosynthesis associated uncharacterized protein
MASLIEPRIAAAVARGLAGDSSLKGSYLLERLQRDLAQAVPRAETLVAEQSGIPAPPPARWSIIDRSTWADHNIKSMSVMLAPLADRLATRTAALPLPARVAQKTIVSIEVGTLLGFISRRVLGQYDLLVPEHELNGGAVYFVGPNLVETERKLGFVPEEFALWVALHEITHRFQFEGVPWLRQRFLDLIHRYLTSVDVDAKGLRQRLSGAVRRLMARDVPMEEKSPMYLFATDAQRELLDEIQALMTVVEGHGNYVMDAVGSRTLPSFERMRHIFNLRRRQATRVQRAITYAIGLEMKMRQYELGQKFCEAVVARGGDEALARLWADESSFPTMREIKEPELWLDRVAA